MIVSRLGILRRWLRSRIRHYRVQLALTLRMTLAAILSLLLAQVLDLPLPLWTVLTALIVTQMSVGRSLKASIDYMLSTVGGTIYGGALAILIPHKSEWSLLLVLFLAVAPLSLLAALRRNLNAVPVSSVIIVLMPAIAHAGGPFETAIFRVLEVTLGVVVGLLVSFLVLPAGGHRLARQEAAHVMDLLAEVLGRLLPGKVADVEAEALARLYEQIGVALADLATSAAEGEQERKARLSAEPDTRPLRETLARLRQDVVTVRRVVRGDPWPEPLHARLGPKLVEVGRAGSEFLRAGSIELIARRPPPSSARLEAAFVAVAKEIAALRGEGLTRSLPDDMVGRFFALSFSLDQMRRNLRELGGQLERSAGDH
jgi:uncharacterized membrane protein YccC